MPQLRDVELFKASILELGKETEILQRWGEEYEEPVAPPKDAAAIAAAAAKAGGAADAGDGRAGTGALADDLASLLGLDAGPLDGDAGGAAASPDDFSSMLGDMSFDDLPPPADGETPEPDDGFIVPEAPSFDLTGFGDSGTEPDTAGSSIPELPDFGTAMEETGFQAPDDGSPDGSGDGLTPEALLAGFGEDLEEAAREAEPVMDLDDTSQTGLPEPTEDLDSFELPVFDESSPAAAEASPPSGASSQDFGEGEAGMSGLDDFSLPDVDEVAQAGTPPEDFGSGMDAAAPVESFEIGELAGEEPFPATPEAPAAAGTPDLPGMDDEFSAFEHFDLGGDASLPEMGEADFSADTGGLDGQLASLEGDTPVAENFSLDSGWGGDFSIPGFETAPPAGPAAKVAPARGPSVRAAAADRSEDEKVREVSLTDAQVDALQDTLLSYPLNLRLAVEDMIANGKGSAQQQAQLIWMLVERAPARDAAKLAGRALKRFIEVPAGFEKRTGASFEAEKGSLAYIFRHSILPMLQVIALAAAGVAAVFFLGYNFVYKPLHANALYAEGYRQIEAGKYPESAEFFDRADGVWTMKPWFYRYAEAYATRAQYPRAEAMYDDLLDRWPKETKAALLYARMESETLYAFEKAEAILVKFILERDFFNKSALLLMVDNYLAWADMEEQRRDGADPAVLARLYDDARYRLAMLMERHGRADAYMERMLLYFIRVERAMGLDKLKEIEPIVTYFMEASGSKFSASTLAELAVYLMDRDRVDFVGSILVKAVDRDGTLPEAHAAMARWSRRTGFPDDERMALEYAVRFYGEADERAGLVTRRVKGFLETLIRLAEVQIDAGESLDAEATLGTAIDRYERALEERRFRPDSRYGKAYSLLAGIYYLGRRDFPAALGLYAEAERQGFALPETDYRRGYMWYHDASADGSAALAFFYRAGLDAEPSPYLLLATANTLYLRSDFFAAQGYYAMLADRLQFELDTISVPSPQVKPTHAEIVELLVAARNNLGAATYRVAERLGDASRRSEAMYQFTESARLYDSLSRDQLTMIRSEGKNLGFLNLDFVLHPLRGMDILIYKGLPTDMKFPK